MKQMQIMTTTKRETSSWLFARARGIACAVFALTLTAGAQTTALPAGVREVCVVHFDRDTRRPARVEDSALPCLDRAARELKRSPQLKLILVGTSDLVKDITADRNGKMRETEDHTGYDVRWEDLAAYRALNTKWYLTHWLGIDPARILPTTDESRQAQDVTFYLVPGEADFNHNYLGTTKTNENPCTVKPCYSPDEETLTAQPRSRIVPAAASSQQY
jgi:hypothetical protein